MKARRVHYEGRVQGVGFRYTTKRIAAGYDVFGWVRNLPDGRVELEVSAEQDEELDDFLEAIRESDLGGHIRGEEEVEIPAPPDHSGFTIRG